MKREIKNNRQIKEIIIKLVKLIGKQGLNYSILNDPLIDNGHFLEFLLLLSKYDPLLKQHLEKIVKKEMSDHIGSKDHGNSLMLLSKNDGERHYGYFVVNKDNLYITKSRRLVCFQSVQDQCFIVFGYVNKKGILHQ